MAVRVRTKEDRRVGPEERLVVTRTVESKPQVHYSLSHAGPEVPLSELVRVRFTRHRIEEVFGDRKSTRLNSSHMSISYAVFCLKKKKKKKETHNEQRDHCFA